MTRKTKKTRKGKEREYERLVEQETLIFEATEMLSELIEESGENRKELAEKLGRSKGFVTQVLAGDRNMTLRTLADFAFALEHRVKVGATPLTEQGDGGEALDAQGLAVARVYSVAGELFARPEYEDAGDDPRRPLAAEGAGLYVSASFAHATWVTAAAREASAQLSLEAMPPRLPAELETVAG
jgi:transcriptional regulator with XRE-family HTH domain